MLFELFRARRLLSGVACLLFCQRLSVGLALLLSLGDGLAECGEFGLAGGQLCLRGCEVGGLLFELFRGTACSVAWRVCCSDSDCRSASHCC